MRKNTLKRIIRYIRKYLFLFILSLIFACIYVITMLYVPILIGEGIDVIIGEGNVDFDILKVVILKILILVVISSIFQLIMSIINNKITYAVTRDIRRDAFSRIQILPLKYLDSHLHGELVSRIVVDVDQFADGLLMGFSQLFTGVVTIIGTIVFMFTVNWFITIIVVVITPVSLFVAKFISSRTYKMFKKQSEIRGKQTSFVGEMITNLKVVKSNNHEKINQEEFDKVNEELGKASLRAVFYSSLTNPCTRFVNSLVYAFVALSGSLIAVTGFWNLKITVGALSCFLSYANQYTKPFNEISSVITELQNAIACAQRVFELIDEEPQIPDTIDAVTLTNPQGNISIRDVYFSYTPEVKLIENFNLDVKKGQKIAIVGPTGCGKTTIINLLMRFYDVNKGQIFVDDIYIKDITRHSLRYNYGMVLQDTWIKKATVKENVAIGKKDATDEEIQLACKKSFADSFIRRLPNGYDTVIGDEGNLSIGQRQLLSIARVMLCFPDMLILDEATSSIDTRTEKKIQEAFNILMENKTSFIVAHRLSTIQSADIILVMKDGNVIEKGNHQELLDKKGFYYTLFNSQYV